MADDEPQQFRAFNYCVSFIDLLGQRDAARGQGLVPDIKSEAEDEAFQKVLFNNIGGILQLQRDLESMVDALSPNPMSPLREDLNEQERIVWDEIQRKTVKTQYWSDGFVSFVCLENQQIKCPVKGVFEIFCMAGYFCLMGLIQHQPVRGAIDIAWGVEIRPGELYGPAVIRAYELESEIAQYPRIIVDQEVVRFLEAYRINLANEPISRANRDYAQHCLAMLAQDDDGYWILHYLGHEFQRSVTHDSHASLYGKAQAFVIQQAEKHKRLRNSKLAFRYSQLLAYFNAHMPSA